jgi:chitodextrinase
VISTYVDGNLQAQQTAYTTASSMTISSLTAGTQYTFKVAARNSYGVSPQSAVSNVVTPT